MSTSPPAAKRQRTDHDERKSQSPFEWFLINYLSDGVILKSITDFLDPWSLFQLGKVAVGGKDSAAAGHEIGQALIGRTALPGLGYLPYRCDDLGELLFTGEEEGLVAEPISQDEVEYRNKLEKFPSMIESSSSPKSLTGLQINSAAWKRRYQFTKNMHKSDDMVQRFDIDADAADVCARSLFCPTATAQLWDVLKDTEKLNCWQWKIIHRFLQLLCGTSRYIVDYKRRKIMIMDDMINGARITAKITFSCPLEQRYEINSFVGVIKATLRDLACCDCELYKHRWNDMLGENRSDLWAGEAKPKIPEKYCEFYNDVPPGDCHTTARYRKYKVVDEFSCEELIRDVEGVLGAHIKYNGEEYLNGGNQSDDYLRPKNEDGNLPPDSQEDSDWESWLVSDNDDCTYEVDFDCNQKIERFLNEKPYRLPQSRETLPDTTPSIIRENFGNILGTIALDRHPMSYPTDITLSAEDLARMIAQDFAIGVAVKPFLVQRKGLVPVVCYLVIGKHHGTCMASFTSPSIGEDPTETLKKAIAEEEQSKVNPKDTADAMEGGGGQESKMDADNATVLGGRGEGEGASTAEGKADDSDNDSDYCPSDDDADKERR